MCILYFALISVLAQDVGSETFLQVHGVGFHACHCSSCLPYTLWLVLPRSWHSGTCGCVLQQDHPKHLFQLLFLRKPVLQKKYSLFHKPPGLSFFSYMEPHCKQDVVGLQAAQCTLLAQTAEAQQNSIRRPLLQQKAAAGASQSQTWSGVTGHSRGERTTSGLKRRSVPWTCRMQQQAGRDLG